MLKLFKSNRQIIQEIHNEFDTAQERLLSEAKQIIQSATISDKAERLEKIGFTGTEIVKKAKEQKGTIVKNNEQAELIEYYKQTYPFHKFITESELDRICKKYNLIYAPINYYKGDVPEKNISDIELAQPRKEVDLPENVIFCEITKDNTFSLSEGNGDDWCGIWGRDWYKIPKKIQGHHFYNEVSASVFIRKNYGVRARHCVKEIKNVTIDRSGLYIAANKSQFDFKNASEYEKMGATKISILEFPDPIVFRYVRGGVQIITKWGLEANDEALVNEKMN